MNINSLLNSTDFSLNRPLNYYSSSRDEEIKVEDVDEDDQEDYSDMPPLIPVTQEEPETPHYRSSTELFLWRDLVEDYQKNIREYQKNMENILRITETVLNRPEAPRRQDTTRNQNPAPPVTPSPNIRRPRPSLPVVPPPLPSSTDSSDELMRSLLRTFTPATTTRRTPSPTRSSSSSSSINRILQSLLSPITLMEFEIDPYYLSSSSSSSSSPPSRENITNATETFIYSVPSNSEPGTCPITLESFTEGETLCKIKHCGHVFKDAALKRWFTRNPYCPSCRHDIREN